MCSPLKFWNAFALILVTVGGRMLTLLRTEYFVVKAPWPMVCSSEPAAKLTDLRLLQLLNALSPMLMTLAGIVTVVSELHPAKA